MWQSEALLVHWYVLKCAIPGLFFVYFWSFQTNNTILHQIYVKNVHPVYRAGIRTHNLSEQKSLPITTRSGLPPNPLVCFIQLLLTSTQTLLAIMRMDP